MNTLERYDALVSGYLRMARRNNLTETTVQNYNAVLRHFRDHLQSVSEQDKMENGYVGYSDVQAWIDALTDRGTKPTTIKQYLVSLGQFFSYATKPYIPDELRYEQSPVSPDFYPKIIPEQIPEILADEQIMELWRYERRYGASEGQFARNYAIVTLILCTGLRNKEVLDLRLSDLDFRYREITVTCGKGRKSRVVDMPDLCAAAIENYLNSGERPSMLSDNDYLFGTTAAHEFGIAASKKGAEKWHRGSSAWLSGLIERHVEHQTGVPSVRSHDLRHLFARISLNATGNLAELQGAMGHASPLVTERYSGRLMQRRRRDSARAVLASRDAAAEQMKKRLSVAEQRVIALPA